MLDAHTVRRLIEDRGDPRVSIFLPTHVRGAETRQDPIRLANLLDEAERSLELGADGCALLAPARRLLRDEDFWLHQGRGLALFLSPDGMQVHRLPLELREKVVVSNRFHVKPLVPLLTGDGRFHVLALSQSRVRLFEASRDSIREMDLHDVPESIRDAVGYDFEEKSLQFHAAAAGGGTTAAARSGPGVIFHGQGAGSDDTKQEVRKFLRLVDRGVHRLIADRRRPLVLAAVDYLVPMYRMISKYPHILDDAVEGNPDRRSPEELQAEAWDLVEPRFAAVREAALDRYASLGGGSGDHTSDELEEVVPAAFAGRVRTLFVARDVERWGRFDAESSGLLLHGTRAADDDDLLDVAAAETMVRDGEIYALNADEVPGGSIAAIFRY